MSSKGRNRRRTFAVQLSTLSNVWLDAASALATPLTYVLQQSPPANSSRYEAQQIVVDVVSILRSLVRRGSLSENMRQPCSEP
jgi:hypothetical protein